MTHQPEKLNLWDRVFNRYRKEVADRGTCLWGRFDTDLYDRKRHWVEYRIIDRVTGSETIEREYLTP